MDVASAPSNRSGWAGVLRVKLPCKLERHALRCDFYHGENFPVHQKQYDPFEKRLFFFLVKLLIAIRTKAEVLIHILEAEE